MMKRSIYTILSVLLCFFYVTTVAVPVGAATDRLADLAETVAAEWFTDHEPADAVTKNLTLKLPSLLAEEGIYADFASSDLGVLTISGELGTVIRDAYADRTVALTVTLKRASETAEKTLSLTVLSCSTKVFMSESFYYPAYRGQLIHDVAPIVDAMGISASTSSLYGGGWASTYRTSLDETTINGRRFKTVLEQEEHEYCLYSYRKEAFEEYNYTKYTFRDKPTGRAEMSMRLKFAETEPNQIYLFQLWANYLLDSGDLKRFKPIEIQFHRRSHGRYVTLNGQGIAHEAVPATGEWFTCRIAFDLDAQTYDFYINQTKINATPVAFYDRGDGEHANCRSINDFHFNSYRTYGGGVVYLDDMVVKSDNSYYETNQHKLRLADMTDFSKIACYSDGSSVSADSVTESFTLDFMQNREIAAQLTEHNLSVVWETSDDSLLSVSGNSVTVKRGLLTQQAVLTAKIQQNGDGIYVEKPYELTIPALEGTETLNAAYQALREETMTHESPYEVTQDLTLPVYEGITIEWESSCSQVLTQTGKIIRPEEDQSVTLTAVLSDTNGNRIAKSLTFCVLAKGKCVYGAENFYHPQAFNKELSETAELRGWRNIYTASLPRLTNTVVQERDGNYVMQTGREASNEHDYNFCLYRFPKALENEGTVTFRFQAEHAQSPQIYVLQLLGSKRTVTQQTAEDGTVTVGKTQTETEVQIAEIQLYYTGTGGRILAMSPTEAATTVILTNDPPEPGRWYTARFAVNNMAQTYDFYLDGKKLNTQPIAYYSRDADADFTAVSHFKYNSYRYHGGSTLYVDDVSVVGKEGVQLACLLYDNGTEKTDDPGQVISGRMKAKVYMYNCRDTALSANVYLGVYQGGRLLYVKESPVTLQKRVSGVTVEFSDLSLPRGDAVEVKAFLLDAETLVPYAQCSVLQNHLEALHAKNVTDSGTGRSYQTINLFGENSVKGYFTQQGWSVDNTKFYFWDDAMNLYQYDLAANKGSFIDRGLYDYNIVTTPQNHLFYLNRNREIIKMDCDTQVKTVVTTIPSAYCAGKVSMLQVANDESRLSVDWQDTGGTAEDGPVIDTAKEKRFAIYDMQEERWLLDTVFGFDTPELIPNHLNLNPASGKTNLVLFAHEGQYVTDRIWVMDVSTGQAYNAFRQKMYNDTDAGESAGHETWSYDGERILFCKSGKIGYGGLVTVRYDGTDRRYINSDYDYLHAGISPVTDRWIVSDTSYGATETSQIVLVDSYTGDSYPLATVHQTGLDPGHCHPGFSQDGNTVWFGLYDENDVVSIGWMDVSDIIAAAPAVHTYALSDNCRIETAERLHEVQQATVGGKTAYRIPQEGVMRVQFQTAEAESCAAAITIRYFDEGTADLCLDYYVWEKGEQGSYSLTPKTHTVTRTNTNTWKETTVSLAEVNLENMERLGADFVLRGADSAAIVQSVSVSVQPSA